MSTIFISYSHQNQDFVRKLRKDLIDQGHTVRWDRDADGDENLPHRLDEWRHEADVHLAVITRKYLQSTLPLRELAEFLQYRQQRGTTLIPLLLEPVELPESLRHIPFVHFTGSYESAVQHLLAALEAGDESPGTTVAPEAPREMPIVQAGTPTGAHDTIAEPNRSETANDPVSEGTSLADALEAYEAAIQRFPDNVIAQTGRAELLMEMGQLPEALAAYEAIIHRFPDSVVAQTGRAQVIKAMGQLPEALAAYEETIQQFPDEVVTLKGRAEVLMALGRFAEARDAFEDILKRFPDDVVAQTGRAEALKGMAKHSVGSPEQTRMQEPAQPPFGFSVTPASISDQPALHDSLGFDPYVRAVAEFLTNKGTKPPLTLSIEGEWGSGKSSFMHQLQQTIRDRQAKTGGKTPITVWFNPWRHDREEAVWAAFALQFLRGVSVELPFVERWRGHLRLMGRRFSWRDGWLDGLRAVTAAIAAIAAISILVHLLFADGEVLRRFAETIGGGTGDAPGLDNANSKGSAEKADAAEQAQETELLTLLLQAGGAGASLAVAVTLWKQVKSFVANPLRFDLKQYFHSPDYQSRISFIEHFHEDFGKIVKAYVGDRKVYVFIDDLDRCETPKAADLMQALNLMIGTAEQPIVFILGMDREKIAASLAVKFKDLLPYVTADPARPGKIEDGEAALRGLEYGSEFIEKFVQLSFRIPQPRDADVAALLRSISGDKTPATPASGTRQQRASVTGAPGLAVATPGLTQIPVNSTSPFRPRPMRETGFTTRIVEEPVRGALQQEVAVDSERLHDIVRMVAPTLDYNPRRVKQFVNVFRLKAYVAIDTGLVNADTATTWTDLTFEKLGKFVALGLRWPLLLADLDGERDLLERLQARALGQMQGDIRGAEAFWLQRARLLHLLRAGLTDDEGKLVAEAEPTYSLKGLDVDALLQVAAPSTVRVPAPESGTHANA